MSQNPLYSSFEEEIKDREEDIRKFEESFKTFLSKNNDQMGLILKCHLILEYYMAECLKASYPLMGDVEAARLSFHQKFQLLAKFVFGFPWVRDGVRELNSIRNKVAHNINYEIKDSDLKQIYECMDVFYKIRKEPVKRGNDAIVDFTNFAAIALSGWTSKIQRHSPMTGVSGYNELYKEMAKAREQEASDDA